MHKYCSSTFEIPICYARLTRLTLQLYSMFFLIHIYASKSEKRKVVQCQVTRKSWLSASRTENSPRFSALRELPQQSQIQFVALHVVVGIYVHLS